MLRISYTFYFEVVKNEVFYINVFNIATLPKAIRKYGEFDFLTGECKFHSLDYHTNKNDCRHSSFRMLAVVLFVGYLFTATCFVFYITPKRCEKKYATLWKKAVTLPKNEVP